MACQSPSTSATLGNGDRDQPSGRRSSCSFSIGPRHHDALPRRLRALASPARAQSSVLGGAPAPGTSAPGGGNPKISRWSRGMIFPSSGKAVRPHQTQHRPDRGARRRWNPGGALGAAVSAGVTVSSEIKLLPGDCRWRPLQGRTRGARPTKGPAAPRKNAEKTLTQPDLMRATLLKITHAPPSEASVRDAVGKLKVEELGITCSRSPTRSTPPRSVSHQSTNPLQGLAGNQSRSPRVSGQGRLPQGDQLGAAQKDLGQVGEEQFR